jgi:hypothetical protein
MNAGQFFYALSLTILVATIFAVIGGIITSFLWNWLMPVIFGLPTITIIQAIGLVALFQILFSRVKFEKSEK